MLSIYTELETCMLVCFEYYIALYVTCYHQGAIIITEITISNYLLQEKGGLQELVYFDTAKTFNECQAVNSERY